MTPEAAAESVGRSRSAATNLLRLLKLAEPVQAMLREGALDMGHARALLVLDGAAQVQAAHEIVARKLSVRDAERRRVENASGARCGESPARMLARCQRT